MVVLLMVGTVPVSADTDTNPQWGQGAGVSGGSIGHINPVHRHWKCGNIYPGPDDCGYLNGEAEMGSQHTLPAAVQFDQEI